MLLLPHVAIPPLSLKIHGLVAGGEAGTHLEAGFAASRGGGLLSQVKKPVKPTLHRPPMDTNFNKPTAKRHSGDSQIILKSAAGFDNVKILLIFYANTVLSPNKMIKSHDIFNWT